MSAIGIGKRKYPRLVPIFIHRKAVRYGKLYFTIAGTNHHYGTDFMEPGMEVNLVKDSENEYDKEAIKVEMKGLGLVGFVANSPHTVKGESMSAGRLYDRMGDTATGKILYVLPQGVLCEIVPSEKMGAQTL